MFLIDAVFGCLNHATLVNHEDTCICIQVVLKTLIVIHRILKHDPSFHQDFVNFGRDRGLLLNLTHFRDDSSPEIYKLTVEWFYWCQAWNYSVWVRGYALYLEERVECFNALKYDVDKDQS
ncbi:hypothetical protein Goarm_002165, partial [Gossypium armourianum]|nr:hypothetical protein [Gossypium armourianum]